MLLLPKNAKLIGQGITGSEGSRALEWAKNYGTDFVAGVTPGKGGQEVLGVPIFNSVQEAIEAVGEVDGAVLFVPPMATKSACFEALDAGIKFVLAVAEKIIPSLCSHVLNVIFFFAYCNADQLVFYATTL